MDLINKVAYFKLISVIYKIKFNLIVYDKKQFTSTKNKKISLGSLPARYIKI